MHVCSAGFCPNLESARERERERVPPTAKTQDSGVALARRGAGVSPHPPNAVQASKQEGPLVYVRFRLFVSRKPHAEQRGMYSQAHEGITLVGTFKSCLDRQVRARVRGEGSDQPQAPSLVEREREGTILFVYCICHGASQVVS